MNQSSGVPSDEELPDDGGAGPAPRPENAPSAGGIQAADAQTIGEQLRHAREAAGLTLAEIAQAIATSDINIRGLTMGRVAADFSEFQIDVEVWDLRQLNHLLSQLRDLPSVSTVKRLFE